MAPLEQCQTLTHALNSGINSAEELAATVFPEAVEGVSQRTRGQRQHSQRPGS